MARIQVENQIKPLMIRQFKGLNLSDSGDTEINMGESGNMDNCIIEKDFTLSKADGYIQLFNKMSKIQGMWYGYVNNKKEFVFASGGHVYKFKDGTRYLDDDKYGDNNLDDLGTLTDSDTSFFGFNNNLYIINGYEYKVWTGAGLIEHVEGYIPKIRIACSPTTGAGVEYEPLNVLTGKKRITYKADNTTIYQLPEKNVYSIDLVLKNGIEVTSGITKDIINGTVTFATAPAPVSQEDDIEIYWTKGTGQREEVVHHTHAFIYGQSGDTRVFLYGNKNNMIYSGLANGVASAEYFGAGSFESLGSTATKITGMGQQQNLIMVFKENETYISRYDVVNLDGIDKVSFPTSIINVSRGNIAVGQVGMLDNSLYTLDTGFIRWYATEVKDERNVKDMGLRIQKDLNAYNLTKAITVDFQEEFNYYIAIDNKIWIYNYKLDTFSRLTIPDNITSFIVIEGNLFFGTDEGQIMRVNSKYLTYNGTTIKAKWTMNMYDFNARHLKKSLKKSWITMSALARSGVDVKYITNTNTGLAVEHKELHTIFFGDVDFSDFSFMTNFNPKTFKIRLKQKKWNLIKMELTNEDREKTFKIIDITMIAEYGNEIKEV